MNIKRFYIISLLVLLSCFSYANKAEQYLCNLINQQKYGKALKQLERIDDISDEAFVFLDNLEEFIDYAANNGVAYESYIQLWYWYAEELSLFGDMASISPETYTNAEYYYLNAAEIYSTLEGDTSALYIYQLRQLMELYASSKELDKSATILEQLIEIHSAKSDTIALIEDYNSLGIIYYRKGNNTQSDSIFEVCDSTIISIANLQKQQYLNIACNEVRALTYYLHRDYSRALPKYKKLIEDANILLGKNEIVEAIYNTHIGAIMVLLKQYDEAKSIIEQAYLTLSENNNESVRGYYNLSAFLSARLHLLELDFEKAKHILTQLVSFKPAVMSDSHWQYITALDELAVIYFMEKDYDKAYEYILECVEAYELAYTMGAAKYEYPNSLFQQTLILERNGKYLEAYDVSLKSYKLLNELVKQNLSFLSAEQRDEYWSTMQYRFSNEYPNLFYKYYAAVDTISGIAYDNELFYKGILLSTTKHIQLSILESGDTMLISLFDELQQIQSILISNDVPSDLSDLFRRRDDIDKLLTNKSTIYRTAKCETDLSWKDVQKNLSNNEIAIEFTSFHLFRDRYTDSTMYCALFLRNDSEYPELISLFEEKEITSFLSAESGNITNKTYDFYANGDTISQLVWSKILPQVKKGETIYFAPSGLLHQLAIEYLPYDENRTMSDAYNLVRLSSTREIVLNKQKTEYTTATIYGGIQYDLDSDTLLAESERYAKEEILASRGIENDTLNRGNVQYLPGTKKEAEIINTLLIENKITARLYTSSKANEESFKSLSGKHNNIIHIGTHGFTWTDNIAKKQDYFTQRMQMQTLDGSNRHAAPTIDPLTRCGLLFAGSNIALSGHSSELPEGVQDGILTAKEISLMDLRDADLVVLSACETAKGDITSEGVFGLQRAFKMAGVQTIIMSLWKVNDQATQLLMTEFYNNWIGKHQSKRDAFRNAQNTVRAQYEEPEYWAGFIMLD